MLAASTRFLTITIALSFCSCTSSVDETYRSDASLMDSCRSQCGLGVDPCDEVPFGEFPIYEVARSEWTDKCEDFRFLVAGTCDDGSLVLVYSSGFGAEARFYDKSGTFRGLRKFTDSVDPVCRGKTHWPEVIRCDDAVTTEVLCGDGRAVGDPVFGPRSKSST